MTTVEQKIELRDKLLSGMEKVYEKLVEYKKQKKSDLVVLQNNKVVHIKPY